ncbi:hypothetical protein [Paracoccus yeei]|uniref:Lipoprotein n=1 Tax=Paracoccus yeei TaxID=147645 RepID=A0A5P2QS23_9RHOB|nr:hypothetical protein [Paracoccus yeei]QEU08209.1 hypothetical protein FOB51_09460 [Paracoccus yeei]
MKTILSLAALPLLAACAQSPASIQPVSYGNAFAALSCQQAAADLTAERQTLAALEAKQRSAQVGDAIGVFLIAVPVSSLTGNDRAGAIAASKGKVLSLEARAATCTASR